MPDTKPPRPSGSCPGFPPADLQSDTVDAEGNQRIWGTHHRRRDMETVIWRFLTTFRATDTAADEGMATYTHLLRQVHEHGAACVQLVGLAGHDNLQGQQGGICVSMLAGPPPAQTLTHTVPALLLPRGGVHVPCR